MNKKIKIGIPRGLLYYRYYILWKNFFEILGANVLLSPLTNKDIIDRGSKLSIDEACLPSKIYLGHVDYLSDKCDYLLIPRISNYGRRRRVCMKFMGMYDIVKNIYPNVKILDYNIDYLRGKYEFTEFIKMGFKVCRNIFKIIYAYFTAKYREKKYNKTLINSQYNTLKKKGLKVLIVSHPYVIYDNYLGNYIINYLKNENIDVLFSDRMDKKESLYYGEDFSNTLYFLYSRESMGSLVHYKNALDGIIYLTSFPCGPDSLVNELAIRKYREVPSINIIIDDAFSEVGLETRLESFVDMLKGGEK